jgi:hypothetical protein
MKTMKLFLAVILAGIVFTRFTSVVSAATTVEQNQKQELAVVCEVGSYGQAVNCRAKGTQEQNQKAVIDRAVVYRDGRVVPMHKVVDTGVDSQVLLFAGMLLTLSSAVVFAAARK